MAKGAEGERIVGRYALYGEIASGGMATVHYGRLIGPVGFARTVAIKRLHSQFAKDPEFVTMFLEEARLAARIRHPNAVSTLDVVALDGELFVIMDYVQGEALGRLLRLQRASGVRIPLPVVGAIIIGALHGLHAAHEARSERGDPLSIVHRDISPQNIMVGVDGVARVLDFGVAKAAGRAQVTRDGQIKGKLPYMAPEQIRGDAVDQRVDVYAAAVVLWETLAGKQLFAGDNDAMIFGKVIAGAKDPPSRHDPNIPPELDAIVMQGLKRDPEARFATAREMAIALEEVTGVASPRRVGEWIEALARDSLTARADRIKEIERSSSGVFVAGTVAGMMEESLVSSQSAKDLASPVVAEVNEPRSQISTISVSGNTPAQTARPSRAILVSVGALAIALACTVLWVEHRGASNAASDAAPPSSSTASSTAVLVEQAPSAPAAASSTVPAVIVSASPIPSLPPRKTIVSAPARATPKPSCNPPFVVDSTGIKRPKPECL